MKTIRIAVLNIVMPPPHSPARYVELLKTAFRLHRAVNLRGDFKGMIGACSARDDAVNGQMYKFFNLDMDSPWFDISRRQQAEEDDLAQISIPENLKPHHQSFDFILFPRQHKLAYVSSDASESLSPATAKKLLDRVFADHELVRRFGEVFVTVEPRREQLQRILDMPRLKRLRIEISPPNPDDLDDAEQDLLKRMENERAKKMVVELGSSHPKGLAPDKAHKTLARIAQSNGKVVGSGENSEGRVIQLSTVDQPLIEPVTFDPNIEMRSTALQRKAQELMRKLRHE